MPKKALIVEDSRLMAKMYLAVFCAYPDCELVYAANGLEGLDQLALHADIDLIILDINMPKMNGLAFLEAMNPKGYMHIPVIVITTEQEDEKIRRALASGAKAFVKKPWKKTEVCAIIDRVVNRSGGSSS